MIKLVRELMNDMNGMMLYMEMKYKVMFALTRRMMEQPYGNKYTVYGLNSANIKLQDELLYFSAFRLKEESLASVSKARW
jgi:hypothetical protein